MILHAMEVWKLKWYGGTAKVLLSMERHGKC
jgi:hypothetical protein